MYGEPVPEVARIARQARNPLIDSGVRASRGPMRVAAARAACARVRGW